MGEGETADGGGTELEVETALELAGGEAVAGRRSLPRRGSTASDPGARRGRHRRRAEPGRGRGAGRRRGGPRRRVRRARHDHGRVRRRRCRPSARACGRHERLRGREGKRGGQGVADRFFIAGKRPERSAGRTAPPSGAVHLCSQGVRVESQRDNRRMPCHPGARPLLFHPLCPTKLQRPQPSHALTSSASPSAR